MTKSPYPRSVEIFNPGPSREERKVRAKGITMAILSLASQALGIVLIAWPAILIWHDTSETSPFGIAIVGLVMLALFVCYLGLVICGTVMGYIGKNCHNRLAAVSFYLGITQLAGVVTGVVPFIVWSAIKP